MKTNANLNMNKKEKYIILEKAVGETPLDKLEEWRANRPDLTGVPLAYAGRLDPMASGKLLVLIGDECKQQAKYHGLDKTYEFEVLFGISSDSGDVLGLVTEHKKTLIEKETIVGILDKLTGQICLPYPIFSSRTVKGVPLHTWAVMGRLNEIEIPTKESTVYNLELTDLDTMTRAQIYKSATEKIASLPTVTDPRKALGNDFRRPDVLATWQTFLNTGSPQDEFTLGKFICTASSGTYMRSLAEVIAQAVDTTGLAFSIHRTTIGHFSQEKQTWIKKF